MGGGIVVVDKIKTLFCWLFISQYSVLFSVI